MGNPMIDLNDFESDNTTKNSRIINNLEKNVYIFIIFINDMCYYIFNILFC